MMHWLKDIFKDERPRGLIEISATGAGLFNKGVEYEGCAEVREVERHGDLSRIKVVKLTGLPQHARSMIPEWVNISTVTWLDRTVEK